MKIAVFGGAFNPIHIGHLAVADSVIKQFNYDLLLFVPVHTPPHKRLAAGATNEDRLEMLRLATQDNSKFLVDDIEILRGGISYTYETVIALTKRYQTELTGRLGYVIGSDWLKAFDTWNRPNIILQYVDLIIAQRPVESPLIAQFNTDIKAFSHPYTLLKKEPLAISSSAIREAIAAGDSWRYLVPPCVYDYITTRGLYGL